MRTHGDHPRLAVTDAGLLVAEGAGNLLTIDAGGKVVRTVRYADGSASGVAAASAPPAPAAERLPMAASPTYREPQTLAVLQQFGARAAGRWQPTGQPGDAWASSFYPAPGGVTIEVPGAGRRLVHLVYRHAGKPASVTLSGGVGPPRTFVLDLPTPEYRVVDLPAEAGDGGLTVAVAPCEGLEVAELSVWAFDFPGSNALFVRPDRSGPDSEGLGVAKPARPDGDPDTLLDDKDPAAAAKAASGKMKNAAIFANNPDPDQVEGHYLRATGNPLQAFDGQRFAEGNPGAWARGGAAPFGARLLVDLNHVAKPRLCVTCERTLRQSEVMRGIAVLRGKKADFNVADGRPRPARAGAARGRGRRRQRPVLQRLRPASGRDGGVGYLRHRLRRPGPGAFGNRVVRIALTQPVPGYATLSLYRYSGRGQGEGGKELPNDEF